MAMAFNGGRPRRPDLDMLASLYGNPAANMGQAMPVGADPMPAMGGGVPPAPVGGGDKPSYMSAPRPARMFGGGGPSRDPLGIEAQPASLAPETVNAQPLDVQTPKIKPHFFDEQGVGTKLLKGFGEVALQYSASQGNEGALMTLRQRMLDQQGAREDERWNKRHQIERDEALGDRAVTAALPQYFSGSEDRVRLDPTTGQTTKVFDAPTAAESYAQGMGYQPGTEEYRTAMQDYTLRGWGSTAMAGRQDLADDRFQHQADLTDMRFRNSASLRGMPSYANLHPRSPASGGGGAHGPTMAGTMAPILAKVSRGETLSPAEQQAWGMYRPGRGGGRGAASGSGTPVMVRSPNEARNLAPGTVFQTPDGRKMVR